MHLPFAPLDSRIGNYSWIYALLMAYLYLTPWQLLTTSALLVAYSWLTRGLLMTDALAATHDFRLTRGLLRLSTHGLLKDLVLIAYSKT